MKPKQYLLATRNVATLVILLCVFSSCSRKLTFSRSAIVPAAQGAVRVNRDKNDNYAVDLNIRHLSPPERLVESRNVYVVWANTRDNGVRNMGQLNSRKGLFSKMLRSNLQTVMTFEPTNFFITAEREANIQYPEGQVILTTRR
ncbi:hypothetical protein [Dyadobacter sp. 50-39]|uniref:hypothetical protein n=1 Tax=Dyadobacter sp. 50-39 TaxID=1895756 RepID=UPI0025C07960|nr:hypothetical protein [Dyadobacter sp. 50-39]